ncbi:MAG TPA: 3'(2'),5'-bisphosphate nucleotidase CysQ [bacterium]|nr:3'(2'),5'-bisphosphate nucleotidase CysQ [bacterium]
MSEPFLKTARDLALKASREVLSLLHQPLQQHRKHDNSLVTEADLRSDAILREGLAKAFPDHAVLTEENGIVGSPGAEYVWMIDPLDGTKAFAKALPGFSVMVGLLKNGVPHLGVVADPLQARLYEAVRGAGAFQAHAGNRSALKVSKRAQPKDMRVVVSTGFPEKAMARLKAVCPGPLLAPINSVGIKVGLVVRQEADIYVSHHPVHFWDTCAPQAILEEAGGVFTKLDGSPLVYDLLSDFAHTGLTLATNGTRHAELVVKLAGLFQG